VYANDDNRRRTAGVDAANRCAAERQANEHNERTRCWFVTLARAPCAGAKPFIEAEATTVFNGSDADSSD